MHSFPPLTIDVLRSPGWEPGLSQEWADFVAELRMADILVTFPAVLVIYAVFPSALHAMRNRSAKGNWRIPKEPLTETPSIQAKLFLLNSLSMLLTIKYFTMYIFGYPSPEVFVTGASLTVVLITVVIYHFENQGIVRPALPLSYVWAIVSLSALYYTTKTRDISHEVYLVTSILMFLLEWAAPHKSLKGNEKKSD